MPPVSLEGQTLGKYRVLEPLGRGGMAQVYRAYHPQLNRYVAVKVLRSDLLEDTEPDPDSWRASPWRARFLREAQAVAALRHANIVQVFDADVQDDIYYMVMELLEGDTLKARLRDYHAQGGRMPFGEGARILLDVLDGLAYAHSEAVIHRDIKPANIMLTRRGQAVIGDFGIAQIVGGTRHTVAGALMGTLNYMAPEQGLEGESDARSDIYSLGIVFYEMLTRRTPFDADTPLAILMKHLNDPLPLPRKIDPTIPKPFERVVLKALAKRPEDRYPSAEEMAQALHEAAQKAKVELPERIPLPLSFTTAEAPSESVAVFSGTAREHITDAGFASNDTEATLGQRLAAEKAVQAETRARRQKKKARPKRRITLPKPKATPAHRKTWATILNAIALLAVGNMLALMVAIPTEQWSLYARGWPVELFLIGIGLCATMYTTTSIWLLIPAGIVLGNGLIFSYYSLTDNWEHWAFLWPLEPLLIGGAIVITNRLAKSGDRARQLSRFLGLALGLLAIGWSAIVGLIALILPG
jgi:serine/threonine protein kinase